MTVIQHHTKYKELDGEDVIEMVTPAEHRKIHGKRSLALQYGISSEEFRIIQRRAHGRSPTAHAVARKYSQSEKGTTRRRVYQRTQPQRARTVDYHKENVHCFYFYDNIEPSLRLSETVLYNKKTGKVWVESRFMATNGKKLFVINEDIQKRR